MHPNTRFQLALLLCVGAGLFLAGCRAATPPVAVTPVTMAATATASVTIQPPASPAPSATQTQLPVTLTIAPTDTPVPAPTSSASPTIAPTATAPPSPTAIPTRVPATFAPTQQPAPSLYSTTSGPAGYSSGIKCERAGAPCVPVMPPGDVSFRMVLSSDASAPWTHFVNYGLSVEKDSANAANMFMFVDAGWLQPGSVVGFGASRNFSQPGAYVIRSSGCMTTDLNSNHCAWTTLAGDVVTFVIQ